MPLDQVTEKRIREMAMARGQDPDDAIAAAERVRAEMDDGGVDDERDAPTAGNGRPTIERLLLGVLPFVKVRELRSVWLGLEERIADDEMMCGEFAVKYGGAASAPAPEAE